MPASRWWWPTRKSVQREEKSVALGLGPELSALVLFGNAGAVTPTAALKLYEESSAAAIPINLVAEAFAALDLVLKVGDEVVKDHAVLDLLQVPSPYYTRELFLEAVAKDFLATGEYYVVGLGNVERPPQELQPISPRHLSAQVATGSDAAASWLVSGNTLAGRYEMQERRGRVRYFDTHNGFRELKQVRRYSTRNNALLRGQSPLAAAAREARSYLLATEHNVSLLEQGGRVSLVFNIEEDIGDDRYQKVVEQIRAQYGGPSNAGAIGVTTGGKMTIQELGIRPKDMDFANGQEVAIKACALTYHVPIALVVSARQTMNNLIESRLALYDDAVLPLAGRVLGGLSDFLLPRFGLDPRRARIVPDQDSVTALVMRRNEELVKRKQLGVESINEIRAQLGREPIEGGDDVYQAATLVPVGVDLFTGDNAPNKVEPTLGGADPDGDGTDAPDPPEEPEEGVEPEEPEDQE